MRCCVKSCLNSWKPNISKSEGISFHLLPINDSLRTAWLNALGEEFIAHPQNAVCSKHFLPKDLYVTKTGVKKVRNNAVPVLDMETEPNTLSVCQICLGAEFKLLPIEKYNLEETYKDVTGYDINKDGSLPQNICVECAQRLLNCWKFIRKCLMSRSLLLDIVSGGNDFTLDTLKTIDRKSNYLTSDLKIKKQDPSKIVNISSTDEKFVEVYIQNVEDEQMYISELNEKTKKIDKRKKPFLDKDNIFTITVLSFEEQVAEIKKRQQSSNYRKSEFKCNDCFRGFSAEEAYLGHRRRHTNEYGDSKCEVCKIHYKNDRDLKNHSSKNHSQRYNCKKCPFVTSSRNTAKSHVNLHAGTKYQCQHCEEEFLHFTSFMSHVRIKHPSDFVCAWCGHCFVSEKGIEQHKRLKHRFDDVKIPADGPMCEACNVRFVSQEAYNKHLIVSGRHNDYQQDAPKRYVHLIRKRIPDGEPIFCELCGVKLMGMYVYAQHFRRKHPGKVRTQYPAAARLSRSKCMCEHCGKKFSKMATLKLHMCVSTGEKLFTCDYCQKSFSQKNNLQFHIHNIHNPCGIHAFRFTNLTQKH